MEVVGTCKICGEEIIRQDLTATQLDNEEKAVYHESFGFACLKHAGVRELFEGLIESTNERLKKLQEGVEDV